MKDKEKRIKEYIEKYWTEERLNSYSYYSGWHSTIKNIIRNSLMDFNNEELSKENMSADVKNEY